MGLLGGAALTITADVGSDGALSPTGFVAMAVKVYDCPTVRPKIEQLVVEVVQVSDPGFEVTVYEVMVTPPSLLGEAHESWASVP